MSSSNRSRPRSPWRLLWLGALVLIVHLMVLSRASGLVAVDRSPPLKALVTRVIEPMKPVAEVEPVADAQSSPPLPRPPKPRPAVRPAPTPPPQTEVAEAIPSPSPSTPPLAAPAAQPEPAPVAAAVPAEPASATVESSPAPPTPAAVAQSSAPLVAAAAIAPNPAVPGSAMLAYQVNGIAKGFTYSATSSLDWKQDGARYDLKYRVSAFLVGERVQTSYGKLGGDGLEPERFSDKARSEVATHFDRDKATVIFSNNAPSVPLTAGAQDRLSIFMQLSALLAGQGSKAGSSTFSMQILSGRDSDVWTFTSSPAETLSLPHGELSAIKVTRKPRKEFDQTVELWFAPSLGWLPVRLKITEASGDFLDQRLKSVTNP